MIQLQFWLKWVRGYTLTKNAICKPTKPEKINIPEGLERTFLNGQRLVNVSGRVWLMSSFILHSKHDDLRDIFLQHNQPTFPWLLTSTTHISLTITIQKRTFMNKHPEGHILTLPQRWKSSNKLTVLHMYSKYISLFLLLKYYLKLVN